MSNVEELKQMLLDLGRPEYLEITPTIEWDDEDDNEWFIYCLRMEYEGDAVEEIELQFCTKHSIKDGFEESLFSYDDEQAEWFAFEILDVIKNYILPYKKD